jgi:hypothetical protein
MIHRLRFRTNLGTPVAGLVGNPRPDTRVHCAMCTDGRVDRKHETDQLGLCVLISVSHDMKPFLTVEIRIMQVL